MLRHMAGEDVRFMAPEVAGRPPPLRASLAEDLAEDLAQDLAEDLAQDLAEDLALARSLARWPAFEPESFVARLTPDERSLVQEARAWLGRKGLQW